MKINKTGVVLAGLAATMVLSMLFFPNFFFGDKIRRVQEVKQGASAADKTEQSHRSANLTRLNEIIQKAKEAKQKKEDLNAKIDEIAKAVTCAVTIDPASCRDTLKTLSLNKNVIESLVTLSKSMPILINVRERALYDIYVDDTGWLIIREDPNIEKIRKFLGVE